MVISHHGDEAEQRRKCEGRRHPLGNKPWKKEFRHQESVLDKKLGEGASMEEKKEREKERGGSMKLKEEKRETERGLEAVESSGFPVETTSWICDGRPYAFSLLHVKEASAWVKVFLVNLYY